jgi:hypothetical protein
VSGRPASNGSDPGQCGDGGGDLRRLFLGQEVAARQDLGAEVGRPRRPDLLGIERQLDVAGVLPGGQYRHGEGATSLLVVLVLAGVDERAGSVVVADGVDDLGSPRRGEVVRPYVGGDRVWLGGPGVEEVAEEGVGVGGDQSFRQVTGLGEQRWNANTPPGPCSAAQLSTVGITSRAPRWVITSGWFSAARKATNAPRSCPTLDWR